ncbi:hypothetical protein ACIP10_20160 [Streptomyces galbus]|uniref:hypothetical protein n=1 Tax=Streptomyces galbus TaxID=33898 RepID=UPI0037925CD5
MRSPALTAALADIDTVFDGFAGPTETGCGRCHLPEETAHLRSPYTRVPPEVLDMYLFEVPDHFDDHAAAMRRLLPQGARAMVDGALDGFGWGCLVGQAGSGSGVWCRASQGGGGSRCGASASDDNAARCGTRRREPGLIDKTPLRGSTGWPGPTGGAGRPNRPTPWRRW